MTRDDLLHAYQDHNVLAFLRVLRNGESSQDDNAYTVLWGGGHFESFDDHPRQHFPLPGGGGTTSAAGAFQIIETTWNGLVRQFGFSDFSPVNQDLAAIALIAGRGALDDVISGRLDAAIRKLTAEWTSLAVVKRQAQAPQVFTEYGGVLAVVPAAGPVPRPTAAPPRPEVKPMGIFAALLPAILQMLPQLIPVLSAGHDSDEAKTWQGAGMVVANTLQSATNTDNIVQAVAAMQKDPEVLAAASAAVNELLPQLMEGGGGGVAGARTFAADHENGRYGRILEVVSYSALFFLLLANGLGFTVGWFKDDWTQMAAIIQADIGVALMVFGFFVGSSLSSKRKDEARGTQ